MISFHKLNRFEKNEAVDSEQNKDADGLYVRLGSPYTFQRKN